MAGINRRAQFDVDPRSGEIMVKEQWSHLKCWTVKFDMRFDLTELKWKEPCALLTVILAWIKSNHQSVVV